MTREEILSKAKYVQLPHYNKDYDSYEWGNSRYKDMGVDIVKCQIGEGKCLYEDELHSSDRYHFTPHYHINYVLPLLAKVLDFNFDLNDFDYTERILRGADLSYLKPKVDYDFEVTRFRGNKVMRVKYDGLNRVSENNWPLYAYRFQYLYPHDCSSVKNLNLNTGRKLIISSDSQMIPDIPVLACYFDEVWYMDNRTGHVGRGKNLHTEIDKVRKNEDRLSKVDFTDVLICMTNNSVEKYQIYNLI